MGYFEDIYIAELMVESNVTLEAQDILSSWNSSLNLEVKDTNGEVHKVTILSRELVAECLIIGQDYNCNCSAGYHWSNEVCYTYGCCDDNACTKNVSFMTPICVQKSKVTINGSTEGPSDCKNKLEEEFPALNSLKDMRVIQRLSTSGNKICDFEANVYVKINTSKLNEILEGLKTSLSAVIFVDTQGMVTIQPLSKRVKYLSTLTLKCTFEEATDRAGWNLSRQFERFELNSGSLVTLNYNCPTEEYKSCVEVKIVNVTGIWSGTYECGFTTGSIRHTARVKMDVSPLPDTITMTTKPLTIDCTEKKPHEIKAITKIPANTETYRYWWSFNGNNITEITEATGEEPLTVSFNITCKTEDTEAVVFITFMNDINQTKRERLEIPMIRVGDKTCDGETLNGIRWPKTPVGSTVINKTCPEGRVGYRSRYCDNGPKWADVYPECVSLELNKVSQAAEKFSTGLGATDEVAKDIFEGIKNSSQSSSDSNEDVADIIASINIVDTMAKASQQISLQEDVFPELVDAASTMLNSNWSGVNESTLYQMSSTYLKSVEHLVKNINVNTSNGFNIPDSSKANDKETAKSILKVVVFLTPLFGVTWALGFFVFILEGGTLHTVVSYMFDILNSFQGLFIFLTGCFAEQKVREELFRIIKAKSGHHDSMKKLSSTATNTSYTKDK
ncbi:unnamed protein product [Menidia menidia]|uniref:(Atlantic silverside) hypothetical protein n=1 Tax=Menidia menidia TaxID=238744 RepID=A0A8S4B0Y7_9TELE|nr:unnamed protein product [Menidia menidia]